MSKIKALIIVSHPGVQQYFVGQTYGGLLLDRIEDYSQERPDSTEFVFQGKTVDDEFVFEAINCPTEIRYGHD